MSGLPSWQFEPLISLLGPIHQSVFLHLLQHSLIQAVWRASVPTLLYSPSYVLMYTSTTLAGFLLRAGLDCNALLCLIYVHTASLI